MKPEEVHAASDCECQFQLEISSTDTLTFSNFRHLRVDPSAEDWSWKGIRCRGTGWWGRRVVPEVMTPFVVPPTPGHVGLTLMAQAPRAFPTSKFHTSTFSAARSFHSFSLPILTNNGISTPKPSAAQQPGRVSVSLASSQRFTPPLLPDDNPNRKFKLESLTERNETSVLARQSDQSASTFHAHTCTCKSLIIS